MSVDDPTFPELTLTNDDTNEPDKRPVVLHDHTLTVEIPASAGNRPAIIRFQREGDNEYRYWISMDGSDEHAHLTWLLDNVPNPRHTRGRKWLVI